MNTNNERKMAKLIDLVKLVKSDRLKIKECMDMHQFCAFWGSYDVLAYFQDVIILVHGATGCVGNRHFLNAMGSHNKCDNKAHLSTELTEKEIIFGGEKKLTDCIFEVEEKYPDKTIAILTNCCADIIGDDVEGCVESLPARLREKIIFLNTGGYSGKSYRHGTENAFHMLGTIAGEGKEHAIDASDSSKKVNLFLRRWLWDTTKDKEIEEVRRMLDMLGIKINEIFNDDMTFDKLRRMKDADLNIALCLFFARGFFEAMDQQFGIPHSQETTPIGLKATISWLKDIADTLDIEVDIESFDEVQKLEEKRKELVHKIGKGRDCIIWNQTGDRLLALTKFAIELEMNPIIVGIEPSIIKDKIFIFEKEVLEHNLDAKIFASKYIEDIQQLIDELDDPIVICNNNYFPKNKVFKYRFSNNPVYGFRGVEQMYEELSETLDRKTNDYSFFIEN
ncbi:nitrogenase component 1 [Anaeromicropila populeti]|uniref:Nitrogenase molybdenum-cofactor synthesis protein NifE n=1 Tax=Anaeromicropila populeti TaxID=37658 RepID=A0A1I6HSU3_9FIRM|nr:nitrogenase component 1 [Anaeromicropila populeti]SFR57531.1 nitrogenase molybdenum-cofactor synthesis protein NifE [Anaeromicropila populeti]